MASGVVVGRDDLICAADAIRLVGYDPETLLLAISLMVRMISERERNLLNAA